MRYLAVPAAAVAAVAVWLSWPGIPTVTVPCGADIGAAYTAASDGDTLVLGSCGYGDQTVPAGSKRVTFKGSAAAVLHSLHNAASNVTFDGVNVDAGGDKVNALYSEPVTGFVFKNASVGDVTDEKGVLMAGTETSQVLGPVFDNVTFHDVIVTDPSIHNECFYNQASGLTVRNSTFVDCATMDLLVTRGDWWGQPVYGGVTVENNDFGASRFENGVCCHYYGLAVHDNMGAMVGWTVRNNRFAQEVLNGDKQSGVFCGNSGKMPAAWSAACSGPSPTTTTAPTVDEFEVAYRAALADLRSATLWKQYAKANPKEADRVGAWLTAPSSSSPVVLTATGRFLVGVGSMYLKGR